MPAKARWLRAAPLGVLLLARVSTVRVSELSFEAIAGGVPHLNAGKIPSAFRGGPRSSACEVLSEALRDAGQVCTVDEFEQKAWLAAMELDCVLNRAQHSLDLLTKRFELEAQAAVAGWTAYEGDVLCKLGMKCRMSSHEVRRENHRAFKLGTDSSVHGITKPELKALCERGMPASSNATIRTMEGTSVPVPTVCDLRDCPEGQNVNSTGQMYLDLPQGRSLILLPQPSSKGTAYGYDGSQVHPLQSTAEVTLLDVHKLNKGLWFATFLATSENFTEMQASYFYGVHHYLRFSGNDPAILMPLVPMASGEGKNGRHIAGQGKHMCIGSPNMNLIDSGNRAEFFSSKTKHHLEEASIRPYWRMSGTDPFTAVASKVVLDSDGKAMGTVSLDLDMQWVSKQFLDGLNLTGSTYAVIVDKVGRIMAMTTNARRLLFNKTIVDELLDYPPRCRRARTDEELEKCSWDPIQPITFAMLADGTRHSGADMSEVLRRMFEGSSNCSAEMQTIAVKFPRVMDPGRCPHCHMRNLHHISACAFGAVPGWGLLVGTEYQDITEAADIRVEFRKASRRTHVQVSEGPRELRLSTKYEVAGDADMRQFPEQSMLLRVENRGHIAIPLKITIVDTATKEFIKMKRLHNKPFVLAPGQKKMFRVYIALASLFDLGTYTGTIHVQADRELPRGICLPDPLFIRVQVKAEEVRSIKILKKLAVYGFLPLICIIIAKVFHQHLRKHFKNEAFQTKMIEEAISSNKKIAHPMVLMSASSFKRLGRLISHEEAQETHEALWLYTVQEVEDFSIKNKVVFISHQWTAFGVPDPTETQYRAMVMSLETLRNEKGWKEEEMYIWVDYSSIPQKHSGTQLLAINSLTVYASHVAAFVVVAPHVVHRDLHEVCDKETYQCRAWCRAEQLAHLLVCGTANMYLAENDVLTPLTSIDGWLEQSTYVFQGDLTCCRRRHEGMERCDKEFLVTPMLGLWAQLCMRVEDQTVCGVCDLGNQETAQEAAAIHAAISDNLDDIFPRKFVFAGANGSKERPLFKDLTDRLVLALAEERDKVQASEQKKAS